MLILDKHLSLGKATIESPNLTGYFGQKDLDAIGGWVFDGYVADKQSRAKWEKRTEAAMDLAMQLQKAKNFPWPNCSNIAFPLVTIGAMQFHSKAYPAIISGTEIAEMRVIGADPTGHETERALRVSRHMSYQVLEEDQPWEEQHDRLLLNLAIVGSAFVKTYQDAKLDHPVSELVLARDLVINYWAKSVESCPRKTHRIPLSRNSIREGVLSGIYRDVLEESWYAQPTTPQPTTQQSRANARTGQDPSYQPDETTPFYALEQHCDLDLDGDGYDEPWIITVEENSKCVLRLVSRVAQEADIKRVQVGEYKGQIISIIAEEYFTKYSFIPSPDGGIYDVGFGVLLGPLNESVNSIVNQLVDSGTMSNTAGGFLGRGAKIRGGVYQFTPFGWNRVDSTGDDLHKSVFPLPVREPSNVLFQLLGFIVTYANRISGSTDTIMGENPGQNTPAQTTQSMIEMGMKIYSAIFKRVWRGMKEEFRKRYVLNGIYLPAESSFGEDADMAYREDYLGDSKRIRPVANPNVTSEAEQLKLALGLREMAHTTPGYDWDAVETRVLKAMHVDDAKVLYLGSKSPQATPIPNLKAQVEQLKLQGIQMKLENDKQMFIQKMLEEHKLNEAKIIQLHAQAEQFIAQAGGVAEGHQIAAMEAAIGAIKQHNDTILQHLELMMKGSQDGQTNQGSVGAMAPGPGNAGSASMGQGAAA